MIAMNFDQMLYVLWAVLAGLLLVGIAAALAWAIRSGQFRRPARSAHLPLWSGIPAEPAPRDAERPKDPDERSAS